MRTRSLSDKIVLYFVIIGITAIAVVSTYSFITFKHALLNRTFDQLTSVRVVKKNQVEQFYQDRLSEIILIANIRGITNLKQDKLTYLWQHLKKSGYYTKIYVQQGNGNTAVCEFNTPDTNLHWSFRPIEKIRFNKIIFPNHHLGNFSIHDFIWDSVSSKARMFISGPIRNTGSGHSLMLALEISIDAINTIMLEQNPGDGLGLTGESYLVGNDFLMRSNSRFQEKSILHIQVKTMGTENAFNNLTGTSLITDYRGIEVLSSYSKLDVPGLNWAILAEIDYDEATKSIYFIRNNILILTIFVGIIVLIISFIFSKRITLPLIKLTEATANIRIGNLNVKLPHIKNDEIGQLTHSFNGMAASLRNKDSELKNERNKRFTAMIDGQEIERQRLSRELHDGLGQSLIALKLKLESIDGKDVCKSAKSLREVKTAFDDTINEIRRISNDLMPAVLMEFGLITALKNICEDISENTDIELNCAYEGKFIDIDTRTTIYLFRIIQEALNNIIKHADATMANVHLLRTSNMIKATIRDNGKGFAPKENNKHTGNGIPNMRERVRLLSGKIDIKSAPGKGTQINIEIPVKKSENGTN